MNIEKFWNLIDSVNSQVDCNDKDSVLSATKAKLCLLPSAEIAEWSKLYETIHKEAYRDDLWDACSRCGIHSTDDGFHYFRAWLISRGRDVFTSVLANPDSLSVHVPAPETASFESYSYISWQAYAEKACQEKLGEKGLNDLKDQWISENRERIESFTQRSHLSFEQACDRLFYYKISGEFDIFKAPSNSIGPSLETEFSAILVDAKTYKIVDRFDTETEAFFTVEVAPEFYVDVKALPQSGLIYVMDNGDGSTVFSNGDRAREQTWPGFEYNEAAVIELVKETLSRDNQPSSLAFQIQSASDRAAKSQPALSAKSKEMEPEV